MKKSLSPYVSVANDRSLHRAAKPPRDYAAEVAAANATGDSDQTHGQRRPCHSIPLQAERLMASIENPRDEDSVQGCRPAEGYEKLMSEKDDE